MHDRPDPSSLPRARASLARWTRPLRGRRSPSTFDAARWDAIRSAGLFDTGWYRRAYPDMATHADPLAHYATEGWTQGRDPNPMFSTSWYLTTYPDVVAAGVHPLEHYFADGASEGRDPGPGFDSDWYLATNADVRVAGANPLGHFLTAGIHEGRRPRPRPVPTVAAAPRAVVLVSGEPATPGHQYRVVRVADAVRRLGGTAVVLDLPDASSTRISDLDAADVVMLWRTGWGDEVARVVERARAAGAAIVFDVDDLMVEPGIATLDVVDGIRSQGLTEQGAQEWFGKMARTASVADVCTASTEALALALRRLGKPTFVIPNGYDDETFVRSRLARRVRALSPTDGLCRIGYPSGSLTHQRDFAVAAPAVADVLRSHPHVRLVLYRDAFVLEEFPEFDDLHAQVEWRDLVPLDALPTELARFDVNLAPLEVGNPFCEAKSALKFFEAALVDVPSVVSPTGPFRAVVTDGVDGFLAATVDDWRAALTTLIADPERRVAMGTAARRAEQWSRGPDRRAQIVRAVLEQALGADGGADAFALELSRARRPEPTPPALAPADVEVLHDCGAPSRVTVVVPVHNYAAVVPEALESVLAQTVDDLDLVVVDDASTDESVAVVRDWLARHATRFHRAVLVVHRVNAGVACARNAGFDLADTPAVLALDADNQLLPRACEALLDALERTGAAFAYPRLVHFGDDSTLLDAGAVRGHLPYSPQRLVGSNYIDALALVRTSAWAGAGGYHPGAGWEDYDLWCRFAELGLPGVQVAEDLARYRVHAESMLHTVTHRGERLLAVRDAITRDHPWLALLPPTPEELGDAVPDGAPVPTVSAVIPRPTAPRRSDQIQAPHEVADAGSGGLSERARALLPMLRCPATREPLVDAGDGTLRSVDSGRVWPIVAGCPNLFPDLATVPVFVDHHVGNALPQRARDLVAGCDGAVLHLSGGGTRVGEERAVELDAAVYPGTDVLGDAHRLPFADAQFDLVLALNAFEHYRDPARAVDEIRRVLRPGGLVFVHTAFLQPVHEAPAHYFNATRYGVEEWFAPFATVDLQVSDNFHPGYAISWLASETEAALADDRSDAAAQQFRAATLGTFSDLWRDPARRTDDPRWNALSALGQAARERLAAGFEYLGRRPD